MASDQSARIFGFVAASVALSVMAVVWYFRRIRRTPEKCNKAGVSTTLGFSGILLLAIWCLRFAVGYYAIVTSTDDGQHLAPLEEFFNSLFGALRTFSMEEEYDKYILDLEALLSAAVHGDGWKAVLVTYATLLNLIAPVLGGAIILEILASVYPKIRLKLWHFVFWRKKYYFSELNPASLALAKSIYGEKRSEKPILIFTDTYIDDEKEKDYELLLEAKQYGAICVRDDLLHVSKPKFGKREYYLMDANEFGNLKTLMGLIEDQNVRYLKNAYIYLFIQSDAYVQVEQQIDKELENSVTRKLLKDGEKPIIVPVRSYRNLVHNLLVDVPLYEPLVHKQDPTKLNVTIFGNGIVGTEAFLSIYWFGQMMVSQKKGETKSMSQCEVTIRVVAKDPEETFWSKIDYINPEFKRTIEVLGTASDSRDESILAYDSKGGRNRPYCRVQYVQADVKNGGFWDGKIKKMRKLLNSDYFIVALGDDADNISVAEKLRRSIGKMHLEARLKAQQTKKPAEDAAGKSAENPTEKPVINPAVIAYAVFDSELSKTLNEQRYYQCGGTEKPDIFMYAFGSLEQVYSCDNVYMSKSKLWAEETGNAYLKKQYNQSHLEDNQERRNSEANNYNYWANLARAMHIKYKVFSLGWIEKSLFDYLTEAGFDDHRDYVKKQCAEYKRIAVMCKLGISEANSEDKDKQDLEHKKGDLEYKKERLAWLEHRRWSAFTRTMGYQYTDAKNILSQTGAHKSMPLKLHSCLVETRLPALDGKDTYMDPKLFPDSGKAAPASADKDAKPRDRLDEVSKERGKSDFKRNDYYQGEFGDYITVEELRKKLNGVRKARKKKYCDAGKYKDKITWHPQAGGESYILSVESVKWLLQKDYKKIGISAEDNRIINPFKKQQEDEKKRQKKVLRAFEFEGSWFMPRISYWLARISILFDPILNSMKKRGDRDVQTESD